jgi:hypothetical protein
MPIHPFKVALHNALAQLRSTLVPFLETLREIHVELEDLNAEAVTLAAAIKKNFAELGI